MRYGFYYFEQPGVEYMIMGAVILMLAVMGKKISADIVEERGRSEEEIKLLQEQKLTERVQNAKDRGSCFKILFFVFILNMEIILLIILLFNVAAQVKVYNFFLNLYLLMYLLKPEFTRANI